MKITIIRLRKAFDALSIEAWLAIMVFATYAYFYQASGFNEAARFDTIRAYLELGTMKVDQFAYNSADLIQLNGAFYSSKAPGTFLLGAPGFWFFSKALRALPIAEPIYWQWVCYFTTLFSVSLLAALNVPLLFRFGRRIGASESDSALVVLAISLGTIVFPFATLFISHSMTATALFFAFYLVFGYRHDAKAGIARRRWPEFARLGLAGFALGFAPALEYPAAIGASLIGVYGLWILFESKSPARLWLAPVAGACLGVLPMAWHNWTAFHDVLYIPYEAYRTDANGFFTAHRKGILGIRIAFLEPDFWPLFFSNLMHITLAPIRGLFYANPVLWLALPGFAFLLRTGSRAHPAGKAGAQAQFSLRGEAALGLVILIAYLCMNASFGDGIAYWGGGTSFGPRHVIAALPFLALPILAALARPALRRAACALVPLSIFFCLMATAIEPRAPYEPANPIFSFYAPKFFTGSMALNRNGVFSDALMTIDSIAFNWGKLLGMSGGWQLLPLYIAWAAGAFVLDVKLRDPSRGLFAGTLLFVLALAFLQVAGSLT